MQICRALNVAVACTAEYDEKQRQAQAAAAAAAGVVPAPPSAPHASAAAPKLPPGLEIPSMPKGWKPGMPIPGDLTCGACYATGHVHAVCILPMLCAAPRSFRH